MKVLPQGRETVHLSRRRFVFGATAGALMAGLGFKPSLLNAAVRQARTGPQTLTAPCRRPPCDFARATRLRCA